MLIQEITHFLEEAFPIAWQEDYDNCGLQIGDPNREVNKALVCVDVTEAIMDEAIRKNCELIIAHHPLIFGALKKITGRSNVERLVQRAIQNNIGIYAIHTNLDNHSRGLNYILGKKLGISALRVLKPKTGTLRKIVTFCPEAHATKVREAMFKAGAGRIGDYDGCSFNIHGNGTFRPMEGANPFVGNHNELHTEPEVKIEAIYPVYLEQSIISEMVEAHPYEEVAYDILLLGNENKYVGSGMIGQTETRVPAIEFLERVKQVCGLKVMRFAGNPEKTISKVAFCGGSGSFLIPDAIKAGADIFLTGDLKYHDFFISFDKIILADMGHYESEQFSKDLIEQALVKKFPNFAVLKTEEITNPIKYL